MLKLNNDILLEMFHNQFSILSLIYIYMFGSGAPIPWEVDFQTEFGALETLHTMFGWLHTTEERRYL